MNLYKESLKINNNQKWAYANISCIYEETNQNEEALIYINKALHIDKSDYKILFNKGVILNKLNKINESRETYKKSISYNDEYPYTFLNLAVSYREENNFYEAIKVISKGIETNKDEGFLYYNRACFYVHVDEIDKALKDIRKSIELDYLFFDYMQKDRELNCLKDNNEYKKIISDFS